MAPEPPKSPSPVNSEDLQELADAVSNQPSPLRFSVVEVEPEVLPPAPPVEEERRPSVTPTRRRSVRFDVEDDGEPPPPRAPTPQRSTPPSEAPSLVSHKCEFAVDAAVGLPLVVSASRVLVYVADASVNKFGASVTTPSLASEASLRQLFADGPILETMQDVTSAAADPKFSSGNEAVFMSHPPTCAIIVVECLIKATKQRFVYGYAVVRIPGALLTGCFHTRLRAGDPRLDPVTSLTVDGVPVVSLDSLLVDPPSAESYLPLAYVKWRCNADKSKSAEDPRQPGRSSTETSLAYDRADDASAISKTPKMHHDIDSATSGQVLFAAAEPLLFYQIPDIMSCIAKYNPSRPIFFNIENIAGIRPPSSTSVIKVHVEVATAAKGKKLQFTMLNDLDAAADYPCFLDCPMFFQSVPFIENSVAIFRVFSIDTMISGHDGIQQIAWSVTKLFYDRNALRNGRFSVPLFVGGPPDDFLDSLMTTKVEDVVFRMEGKGRIRLLSPASLLRFSMGDQARLKEITARRGFHLENKMVLVPRKVKDTFRRASSVGSLGRSNSVSPTASPKLSPRSPSTGNMHDDDALFGEGEFQTAVRAAGGRGEEHGGGGEEAVPSLRDVLGPGLGGLGDDELQDELNNRLFSFLE